MKKVAILLLLLFTTGTKSTWAAPPTWTVNPSGFQYSMVVTGALNFFAVESTDPNDMIGAFVGGQCRGVARPVYFPAIDRHLVFFYLYGNAITGDTLSFQMYDASADQVYALSQRIPFVADTEIGLPTLPYVFGYPEPSDQAEMLAFSLAEQTGPALIDPLARLASIQVQKATTLSALVASFTLSPYASATVAGTPQASGTTPNNFTDTLVYTVLAQDGQTERDWRVAVSVAPFSNANDFLTFGFNEQTGPATIDALTRTVEVEVAKGTDLTALVASFTLSPFASVAVGGVPQVSGLTANEFSAPLAYTITAENGDAQVWLVDVSRVPFSPENSFLAFSMAEQTGPATLSEASSRVDLEVVKGTDLSNLVASFTLSDFASARVAAAPQTSGLTANDFSAPLVYTLVAENGDTRDWAVNITRVPFSDKTDLLAFSLPEQVAPAAIDTVDGSLYLEVAVGTDLTALVAQFTLADFASAWVDGQLQTSGLTANDFSAPLGFVVLAENGLDSRLWTLTVREQNVAPTEIALSASGLDENNAPGQAVATLSATDANAGETFQFELVSGTGGDDNSRFFIVGDQLLAAASFDHEAEQALSVRVRATDSRGLAFARALALEVRDLNDVAPVVTPVVINLPEDQPLGAVGQALATDADLTPAFGPQSFLMLGGLGHESFTLYPSGQVNLVQALDYETRRQHTLLVEASDGANTGTGWVTINITDVNDVAPSLADLTVSLAETSPAGSLVASLSANDPDLNSTFSYSIVAGNGPGIFALDPLSGQVSLAAMLDFETAPQHVLTIEVSDGLNTSQAELTVLVEDLNDETPVAQDATFAFDEDHPLNTQVGSVVATDADAGTELFYSIFSGNQAGRFYLNPNTGGLYLVGLVDFETAPSYTLVVRASDGTFFDHATITLNLLDVNDLAPTINPQSFNLSESLPLAPTGSLVVATDADASAAFRQLSFALVGGDGHEAFSIDPATGELALVAPLDRESRVVHTLIVQVSDGVGQSSAEITVNVLDANDVAPTVPDQLWSVLETLPVNGELGRVAYSDPDSHNSFSFSILSGNESGFFSINPTSGTVRLAATIDHESQAQHVLLVQLSDGVQTGQGTITIEVLDVTDETPVVADETFSISESLAVNSPVGQVQATDTDPSSVFQFSIFSGNEAGRFLLNANTGELFLIAPLDHEAASSYRLVVRVSDGFNIGQGILDIVVEDANDIAPVVTGPDLEISEAAPLGGVGQVQAYDQDASPQFRQFQYELLGGQGSEHFSVDAATGEIALVQALDFETRQDHFLQVRVSDGANSGTRVLTVVVLDANDVAPTAEDQVVDLAEDRTLGTRVATVVGLDPDTRGRLSYSIAAGNDPALFSINPISGALMLVASPDFELQAQHVLTIDLFDEVNTGQCTLTFNILNVNDETPVVEADTVFLAEDWAVGASVGHVVAADPDGATNFFYSIFTGNLAGRFTIDQNTGELFLAAPLDHESASRFPLVVAASDGIFQGRASFVVEVLDVNDEAPAVSDLALSLSEATAPGVVGQLLATDRDASAAFRVFQYAATGGDTDFFGIDPSTGQVLLLQPLDFETHSQHSLLVEVSDGTNAGTARVSIAVTDANDVAPTVPDVQVLVAENLPLNGQVALMQATDPDLGGAFQFSIASGNLDGKFFINQATGELRLADWLDYETQSQYVLQIEVFDGAQSGFGSLTIDLANVNDEAPVVEAETFSVAEDLAPLSQVAFISFTDADLITGHSYSIFSGNEAGKFSINPNTGILFLASPLDHETFDRYNLVVRVSDGLRFGQNNLTIVVEDVNDNAPAVFPSSFSLSEAAALGNFGQVLASDADLSPEFRQFEYSLVGGVASEFFAVDAATGQIALVAPLDYETRTEHRLDVVVSDGPNQGQARLTVRVTDDNDVAPEVNDLQVSIREDLVVNDFVAQVRFFDPDESGDYGYAILAGNEEGRFKVNPSNGVVSIALPVDFETRARYDLTVEVSDGVQVGTAALAINVLNVSDEPPVVSSFVAQVPEDMALNQELAQVLTTDPDNTRFVYSIFSGNEFGIFTINPNTGAIFLIEPLDYESQTSHELRVEVADGVYEGFGTITIAVQDVNDLAPVLSVSDLSLPEDQALGVVGQVSATDADASPEFRSLSFSLAGGLGHEAFAINAATGAISLVSSLDYEARASHLLEILVSDGANTDAATVAVAVGNANDLAPAVEDAVVDLPENQPLGTQVAAVGAADPDGFGTLGYSFASGNEAGLFSINANTGRVFLVASLDFETDDEHLLLVNVSDGLNVGQGQVRVFVRDHNDEAPRMASASLAITEGTPVGTVFHTMDASDDDPGTNLVFSILEGNGLGWFSIDAADGRVFVSQPLDFETRDFHNLSLQVTDGQYNVVASLQVLLRDENDEKPQIDDRTVQVSEAALPGTFLARLEATDRDANSVLRYSLAQGAGQGRFALSQEGELRLVESLDFERVPGYELDAMVSDGQNSALFKIWVVVEDAQETTLVSDNIFSPNEDGLNDFWRVENPQLYQGCEFSIFDHLGNSVYESQGYEQPWRGQGSPVGTYYYLVRCGDGVLHSGAVTLVR